MKVALRFVARRVTPDNTCSAIYGVSMVLLQLQTSAAWTEVVALLWWHPGTVLTSLDLLLILDISRGATPIVVLCESLSIDQLKFCVSCLRCYWYEPTLCVQCDSSQSIQRICGTSSPAQMHGRPKFLCT